MKVIRILVLGCLGSLIIAGCSDKDSDKTKPPPKGSYTDYSEKTSKIEIGAEISENQYYRLEQKARNQFCPVSTGADPQVTLGTLVQVLKTSKSPIRTELFLENHTLGVLSSDQVRFDSILLKSTISDYDGEVAAAQPVATNACTIKADGEQIKVLCENYRVNWTGKYLNYLLNRIPSPDEGTANCSSHVDASHLNKYYLASMTTASDIRISAVLRESTHRMTLNCKGKPAVDFELKVNALYSSDLVSAEPIDYMCRGFNQVRKVTTIRDLNGQTIRVQTEEFLNAPVRMPNPKISWH